MRLHEKMLAVIIPKVRNNIVARKDLGLNCETPFMQCPLVQPLASDAPRPTIRPEMT